MWGRARSPAFCGTTASPGLARGNGVAEADPSNQQLRILRYLRDHGVATTATLAHEVFSAPRTTFGRILKVRPTEHELAQLVANGHVAESGHRRHAEYMLTVAGRQLLRDVPLRRSSVSRDLDSHRAMRR